VSPHGGSGFVPAGLAARIIGRRERMAQGRQRRYGVPNRRSRAPLNEMRKSEVPVMPSVDLAPKLAAPNDPVRPPTPPDVPQPDLPPGIPEPPPEPAPSPEPVGVPPNPEPVGVPPSTPPEVRSMSNR
jgi:hypothetical protein